MPMLGLTMEEGTVAAWLKQEGETVERDEPLLTVEMDKGTVEVPSPTAGVLRKILVQPGQAVPVRAPIAEISDAEDAGTTAPATATAPDAVVTAHRMAEATGAIANGSAASRHRASPRARMRAHALQLDVREITGSGPGGRVVEADVLAFAAQRAPTPRVAAPAPELETVSTPTERLLATPLARRLALEHGVDLAHVTGSGPGGRITNDDVLAAAEARRGTPAPQPTAPAPDSAAPPAGIQPLSRLRRLTAQRMHESAHSVARVTLLLEADFTEVTRLRRQLQPEFVRLGVPKLPWDAIVARAAGMALAAFPAVNARWVEGQGILRHPHPHAHVGVAVALGEHGGDGLVVPVLRDADTRSLRALASDLLVLVEKARTGALTPANYEGGTFAITNLGQYRVDGFTPVVIPGQAAILGVGRIAERPAVVDGQLAVRTICTLSLAFDHRVVDGAPAAAFLAHLADLLERPYALLTP